MRKPVPVLLLTHSIGIGGSERQMAEVAKSLDRRRFEPHAACFHVDGMRAGELRAAGVPILHLPVTSFASPTALRGAAQLMRYIHRHRIRLVHSFDVPLNIFAAPVAWLARKPIVLTSQRAHRSLTPGLYHRLLRLTDRVVDGIVVNCEFMRKHLIEDEEIPARLIHLCYNGVDTSVFCPAPAPPHPELAGSSLVIGVVCALRPEKGLDTLIAGFAAFAGGHPQARLAIVGSGPELNRLQELARSSGISERTAFVPSTGQVADWLRAIDIFVLPSLSEAFSNALMEAMACGCCAVASRVGGNPELIDGSRGLLFDAGDAKGLASVLHNLAQNGTQRRLLASAGSEFIRQGFSIDSSVKRMQEIYASHLDY